MAKGILKIEADRGYLRGKSLYSTLIAVLGVDITDHLSHYYYTLMAKFERARRC